MLSLFMITSRYTAYTQKQILLKNNINWFHSSELNKAMQLHLMQNKALSLLTSDEWNQLIHVFS